MPEATQSAVTIRTATAEDAAACGQICYDAFSTISGTHGFPCDLPSSEVAIGFLTMMFSAPGVYSVVAENEGGIVGSNALLEQSIIQGVGPITIDPKLQNAGVGRKLMQAVMDRAKNNGAAGVRLVQAAFHNRSLSLYTSLGFDVREPLSCMQGRIKERNMTACAVRQAQPADELACNALSRHIHGFDRGTELNHAIQHGTAQVVMRGDHVTDYTTSLGFFGHSVAESNLDMQALIASADSFSGPGILVPSRNSGLLRWCLSNGLRIVQPMTLMTTGLYSDPAGAWLPSIVF